MQTRKLCWCCDKPLQTYGERYDGVCAECGIEESPAIDVTDAGRVAADCYRAADAVIVMAVGAEAGAQEWPEPVW